MLELIRRLAEHQTDRQIAAILGRQVHQTGIGLLSPKARVRGVRKRAGIPAVHVIASLTITSDGRRTSGIDPCLRTFESQRLPVNLGQAVRPPAMRHGRGHRG